MTRCSADLAASPTGSRAASASCPLRRSTRLPTEWGCAGRSQPLSSSCRPSTSTPHADEATIALDWVDLFDGNDPKLRFQPHDPAGWTQIDRDLSDAAVEVENE